MMPMLASEALLHENKNSSNNMLLSVIIEPGPLINLLPQVQHSPFWANWAFTCKTETLGSLYSPALLIPTKSSKSKNQVMQKQKSKDPLQVAHARLAQKGECWTWNQGLIRGLGSILTRGNILSLDLFYFHIVKPLMPILALLPMLCLCENPKWLQYLADDQSELSGNSNLTEVFLILELFCHLISWIRIIF